MGNGHLVSKFEYVVCAGTSLPVQQVMAQLEKQQTVRKYAAQLLIL